MSFWKRKKYCKYCGSTLNADGSCPNVNCIAYVPGTTTADTSTAATAQDTSQGTKQNGSNA